LKTISCGLTYDERDKLLAEGDLSDDARKILKSPETTVEMSPVAGKELATGEPLQLHEIPVMIAHELLAAAETLRLTRFAAALKAELKRRT
jgi:hypothetical protein